MRYKYKQWAVDYIVEHPEVCKEKIDLKDPFFKDQNISIEIGSGKGDFIVTLAKNNPDKKYLAVEVIRSIAGMLAKRLVEEKIDNVYLYPVDVEVLFDAIPDGFFENIYLNFSDPWPKKRYAKRRLTHHRFLEQYYRILKDDGTLIFKSDNDSLYEYSKEEFENSKFQTVSFIDDYKFDEKNDAMTEYEKKFRSVGHLIHKITARKV